MLRANQPVRLTGKKMEELRRKCFERDGQRCRECGHMVGWLDMEMAHIIARSKGGSDTLDNVRTLCGRCHRIEHSHGLGLKAMHY